MKSSLLRKGALRELLYRLRTEGDTPGRLAGAVGVGVFIGCSPFYGFHLALCILFARIFRLNQLLTYLAAHISLPGLWPLLVLGEIQVGRLLRGAPLLALHPADLHHPWRFAADLLVGSAVAGAVLAVAFSLPTFFIARRRRKAPEIHALLERTAYRYLDAGMFHWEFVRGKLRWDPVYFSLLRSGLLPPEGRLVDLGCGRGLLLALLRTAREQADRGELPTGWPPPPRLDIHGIEGSRKIAEVARQALDGEARIDAADLCDAEIPPARAILLLDVLHYLPAAAQEDLLARAATALEPGGLLLLRDADAAAGWRFTATRLQERACALARRHWRQSFHYRSQKEWLELLEKNGLAATAEPMAQGTPYGNVLVTGRKRTTLAAPPSPADPPA